MRKNTRYNKKNSKELNTPTMGTLTEQQKKQVKIAGIIDVKKMNATVLHIPVIH